LLYRNLLKYGTTYVTDEKKCVIDTNELIAQKLETYKQEKNQRSTGGFQVGIQAPELGIVEGADGLEGIFGEDQNVMPMPQPVYQGPDPEQLLADAREQIAKMEQEAQIAIDVERKRVLEEAKQEGYTMGYQEGQKQAMAQTDSLKKSLEDERHRLQAEYQHRLEEMEPELIDTLTGIYEHIFQVELGTQRDLIVFLLTSAMSRIEGARDYLVHVAKEDYAYVNMRKRDIQVNSMIGNANMEIIEDISLKKNECLIETEGGIFDCGLGTQLSELTRKLKLLSYEKE